MLGIASIFPTFSKRSWFGVISRGPALFRVAHYSLCPVLKGLPELAKKHRTNHRSHNHCRFTRHRCENRRFLSLVWSQWTQCSIERDECFWRNRRQSARQMRQRVHNASRVGHNVVFTISVVSHILHLIVCNRFNCAWNSCDGFFLFHLRQSRMGSSGSFSKILLMKNFQGPSWRCIFCFKLYNSPRLSQ